jgi:alkylation response protein AidB-like acyl-CoA dehydrogenase
MFVECLAEGRGVSLPAGSVGAGRGVVSGVGAYSRVRKQFRVPIAEFGGIQEGAWQEKIRVHGARASFFVALSDCQWRRQSDLERLCETRLTLYTRTK